MQDNNINPLYKEEMEIDENSNFIHYRNKYNLTWKQYRFLMEYVGDADFIGWKAIMASYGRPLPDWCNEVMNHQTANAMAVQNLQKPNIQNALSDLLSAMIMKPGEVLTRLTKIAKASEADFFDVDEQSGKLTFNYRKAKAHGVTGLIKKINFNTYGDIRSIELHDAQSALVTLGKHHKLFDRAAEQPVDPKDVARELFAELQVEYEDLDKEILARRVVHKFKNQGVRLEDLMPSLDSTMEM